MNPRHIGSCQDSYNLWGTLSKVLGQYKYYTIKSMMLSRRVLSLWGYIGLNSADALAVITSQQLCCVSVLCYIYSPPHGLRSVLHSSQLILLLFLAISLCTHHFHAFLIFRQTTLTLSLAPSTSTYTLAGAPNSAKQLIYLHYNAAHYFF